MTVTYSVWVSWLKKYDVTWLVNCIKLTTQIVIVFLYYIFLFWCSTLTMSSAFVKYLAFSLHVTFPSDKVTLLCIIWLVPARVNVPACVHFSFFVSLNFQARNSGRNQFLIMHNSGSAEFLYPYYCCFDLRVSPQVHCGVTCAPAWR